MTVTQHLHKVTNTVIALTKDAVRKDLFSVSISRGEAVYTADLGRRHLTKFCTNIMSDRASSNVIKLPNDSTQCMEEWNDLVSRACESLQKENLIAVPTDTIYGVAGLAQSTNAVRRLYSLKSRCHHKPISICVGDVDHVKRWGKVTISNELLFRLLPGPVTVVFERTLALNPEFNPGTSLVGIRVPDYGFVRDVARACREPLALTSANVSDTPSTVSVKEFESLWPSLDLVVDGGVLGTGHASTRLGSTVVDLSKTGTFTIIRPGSAEKSTKDLLLKYGLKEEKKQ